MQKKLPYSSFFLKSSAPTEIRTLVLALKGLRPGPLDDGGVEGFSCCRILPLHSTGVKHPAAKNIANERNSAIN